MSGSLTTEGKLEVHLPNSTTANPMLLLHNEGAVHGNMSYRRDTIFHFVNTNTSTGTDYRPLKARYYLAYTTDLCTNLNADLLDGNHENAFLRYRGSTNTAGEGTLWSQIGIKQYSNAYPDDLSNGVYGFGAVVSLAGSSSRLDIWYNHYSSYYSNNGIQYRSGWDNNKRPWRMILDSVNYTNYADGRYVNVSGDTMTGALNFANGTRNNIGDDCGFGDGNVGGCACFQGLNGDTGIALVQRNAAWGNSGSNQYRFTWNGSNMTSSSTALWNNLNADMLDGWHINSIIKNSYTTIGTTSVGWKKVWDMTLNSRYNDVDLNLYVHSAYNQRWGIMAIRLRQNGEGTAKNISAVLFQVVGNLPNDFRLYYNNSSGLCQLWCYIGNQYGVYNYRVLASTWRVGTEIIIGTFYNADGSSETPPSDSYVGMTNLNLSNNAASASQLQTARTFYINSYIDYSSSAGVSFNGTSNVTLRLPNTIICSNWFRSKGNTGWYNEDYQGGIYMIDSTWVRTYNSKKFHVSNSDQDAFNSAGGFYSTRATYGTALASHFLNTGNSIFSLDNKTIGHNNDRPVLTWSDRVTNYGYLTRYSIGSFRPTNGLWGRMRLAVGNNDAGTSYGCVMDISGNGYVEVSGSVYATGAITAKSSGSDIRLKKDIQSYNAMNIIKQFRSVKYHWNDIAKANSEVYNNDYDQYGLIAQDLLAGGYKQWVKDVFKDYYTIEYERLIPVVWKGLQEVDNEVDKLKKEVAILKKRIAILEGRKSLSA